MKRSNYKVFLLLAAMLMPAVSCERRPLEDPGYSTDINIMVDIKAICNVTCDVYNEKIPVPVIEPEVVRVLFFAPDQDKLITEAFVSERGVDDQGEPCIGGSISIVPGTYRLILYSFGTESTVISNYESFDNSIAYTNPIPDVVVSKLLSKGASLMQDIYYQPDHLLVARSHEENIPWHSGTHTIHAKATSVVESYYLQIKIDGLEYVSSAQAVLSGMAQSAHLSTGTMDSDKPSAIYIPLVKSQDKGEDVICNVFNTFGHIPGSTNELQVTFNIRTIDGRTVERTFDISNLFDTEECIQHHWLLLEEHITIDPPENPTTGSSGGYDPVVKDWEEESRDIVL